MLASSSEQVLFVYLARSDRFGIVSVTPEEDDWMQYTERERGAFHWALVQSFMTEFIIILRNGTDILKGFPKLKI